MDSFVGLSNHRAIKSIRVFICLLIHFLLECNAEPMLAQAIVSTNSQYGVSKRLGTVLFTQKDYDSRVRITGELICENMSGLRSVGMHVHSFGNLSQGCDSTGPHYNPTKQKHGAATDQSGHIGDLGNVRVVNDRCIIDISDSKVRLTGPYSILGRSLVLHVNTDDEGKGNDDESQKTGSVGRPRGCGVIAVASDFSVVPDESASKAGLTSAAVSTTYRFVWQSVLGTIVLVGSLSRRL